MGYTNKTSHYDLPQWIAGDKPSWLGDVNTAMLNIDTAIAGADASATAAESSAAAANAQVQAQEPKITKNTTDIQALTARLADAEGEISTTKATATAALPKSGGTMTGSLILKGDPTGELEAATKKYVDDKEVTVTALTPNATYANINPTGFILGSTIFCSACGKIAVQIPAMAVLLSVAGNPLNLTENELYSVGSILADTGSAVNESVLGLKYDGTNTTVMAGTAVAANTAVWFSLAKVY